MLQHAQADGWERALVRPPASAALSPATTPYVRMTRREYDKECITCTFLNSVQLKARSRCQVEKYIYLPDSLQAEKCVAELMSQLLSR